MGPKGAGRGGHEREAISWKWAFVRETTKLPVGCVRGASSMGTWFTGKLTLFMRRDEWGRPPGSGAEPI